jgi:hypothetical protein
MQQEKINKPLQGIDKEGWEQCIRLEDTDMSVKLKDWNCKTYFNLNKNAGVTKRVKGCNSPRSGVRITCGIQHKIVDGTIGTGISGGQFLD